MGVPPASAPRPRTSAPAAPPGALKHVNWNRLDGEVGAMHAWIRAEPAQGGLGDPKALRPGGSMDRLLTNGPAPVGAKLEGVVGKSGEAASPAMVTRPEGARDIA